ncbi:hypothetical protein F5144DRAFT_628227 [Chaetomium tenue]|uniref:Uncharacterized protein n=1 Tax=Chaetomium tenue TaxID=1854479 RepID=A0ACB7PAE3_9PEZI|nr:hypothetical protein F5144DRAFT_628227 [Chaetomium globosum]
MRPLIASLPLRWHRPHLTKLTRLPLACIKAKAKTKPIQLIHHTASYSSSSSSSSSSSTPTPFNPQTYLHTARQKFASQPPTLIHDTLSPTPSHLLTLSLADHVPALFPPEQERTQKQERTLPQGHHLVYFPLQLPPSQLMPDGTDPAHWPGAPFVRRMWAGGEVVFREGWDRDLCLDGRAALCVEEVDGPVLKGVEGDEKVFVEVRRGYGLGGVGREVVVEEVRRLVFMRERVGGVVEGGRVVRAHATPEFTISLRPDATLLFHFSALTYNAHSIHIDPDYARNQEGYKGLLVHGPLTLVLMLSALRACLAKLPGQPSAGISPEGQSMPYVKSLSYRNLAPLYVNEEMKVCLRRINTEEAGQLRWDVWIEGPEGGIAVKGSAITTPAGGAPKPGH